MHGNNPNRNLAPSGLYRVLCFIPLLGGIVGIVLIWYGLFVYKSRQFIITGFGGVLITVIIYSFIFWEIKYGKASTKGFANLSQTSLNKLFESIEFYKLRYGSYPDSLEELYKIDKLAMIDDPLLTRKMSERIKTKFEYYRSLNTYTLYSVGVDGIANTPDDIYPFLLNIDTIKFGLRKYEDHPMNR